MSGAAHQLVTSHLDNTSQHTSHLDALREQHITSHVRREGAAHQRPGRRWLCANVLPGEWIECTPVRPVSFGRPGNNYQAVLVSFTRSRLPVACTHAHTHTPVRPAHFTDGPNGLSAQSVRVTSGVRLFSADIPVHTSLTVILTDLTVISYAFLVLVLSIL